METNYKNLKPGLARRLAYSRQLKTRMIKVQNRDVDHNRIIALSINSRVVMNKEFDNFCNICQEFVEENRLIRILKCSHLFHVKCIMFHFAVCDTCPTCRMDIYTT